MGNGGGAFRGGRAGLLDLFTGAFGGDGYELVLVAIGSLNGFWVTEEPYVRTGGLFAVFGLVGSGGRSELGIGGGGGGGGGLLATVKALF